MQALLGNRYRLGERIADGGMGSVYRAVDDNLGRPVAVKLLRRELVDEPAFLERFRREARAAAAVSHPGVAGVYDYGELDGRAFIVMELVEGETLAERIAARGRLPWREAFGIGEQVARALAAAHAHGLVHRDIKPANVLVDPGGRAKVTDFGIAKAAASASDLTRTGMVLGSANYVAPEQAQGGDVGPAADQYSLGCVLFEAVCGRTPYSGANPVAIATQHVSAPVPDPARHHPGLPAPAAALIRRALAKDPADRFPTTNAMATVLAAATVHSPRPGIRARWAWPWGRSS
jgi:serine/threonine-protein kinase